MKWACLLHDIAKHGVPTIEGKDHVHPINSGIDLLDIFERLAFIPNLDEVKRRHLFQVKRLLGESVQPDDMRGETHGVPLCTVK